MLTIINDINTRNNNKVFDYIQLQNTESYINLIDDITYFDHGSTALCYIDNKTNTLYKVCQKNKLNSKEFIGKSNYLISKGIDILQPKLMYENSTSFVYSQPKCFTVSNDKINAKFCYDVLTIIYKMLSICIIYPDLYYKNFGYYNNKCYLFDYHDSNVYESNENINNTFYVFGIFSLLYLFFSGKNVKDIEEIKSLNYGKDIFPQIFYLFVNDLSHRNFKSAEKNIQRCIEFFSKKIEKNYVQYQYVNINGLGKITLGDHTLNKYCITERVLNYNNNYKTMLDAGCCIGGIGLKIAQEYPHLHVTLNNITKDEICVAEEIKDNLIISNVTINIDNIIMIKNKYDVCFYFSLIHHLLRDKPLIDILDIIFSQTEHYAVIEFPIKGDKLLDIVISNSQYPENYEFLSSLGNLIDVISKYVRVKEVIKVDYLYDSFRRYAVICSKLT